MISTSVPRIAGHRPVIELGTSDFAIGTRRPKALRSFVRSELVTDLVKLTPRSALYHDRKSLCGGCCAPGLLSPRQILRQIEVPNWKFVSYN